MDIAMHKEARLTRHAVQVAQAQGLIKPYITPLESKRVPLEQAYGSYLAVNIAASHPLPHFRRSGMDGFSIRTEDLRGASSETPVRLKVIERIPCGAVPRKRLERGTAARTMTGAMVSEGADAVIRMEMTQEAVIGGISHIIVTKPIQPGANVSEVGSELEEGAGIVGQGCKIRSGETALLAIYGFHHVPVYRSPVVAILSTGEELLQVDEPLQPGKIRNSNAPMLAGLVRRAGGIPHWIGKIGDDLDETRQRVQEALASADLVVSTGGVSVGDYDAMADFFLQWEGKTLFNKVAMRPGSPTTAGVLDGKLIFALSGNPGACFVGFHLFVRPVLLGMQGSVEPHLPEIKAFLRQGYAKTDAYTRYVRGRIVFSSDGRVCVEPAGQDKSSIVTSIKDSDCLICIPPGKEETVPGSLVSVLCLDKE
ncbi:molybdopterin molybdotransferase MoeA [Paenibacillus hemerocallicola]|uniref:Molybdopterin molybdenumtransferase n=1 Tax=Paenibacillus hemerocallicola TaxID=1172614 RepID=A0A5C4TF32_9BACL|nr:gephyrin-like molybdotransferase Glp [Paenibacillus hemerocallicola]TNJ67744.1 molybdopterin molybdotransferase MoeA [Paenibacillus hemerocallicola]